MVAFSVGTEGGDTALTVRFPSVCETILIVGLFGGMRGKGTTFQNISPVRRGVGNTRELDGE